MAADLKEPAPSRRCWLQERPSLRELRAERKLQSHHHIPAGRLTSLTSYSVHLGAGAVTNQIKPILPLSIQILCYIQIFRLAWWPRLSEQNLKYSIYITFLCLNNSFFHTWWQMFPTISCTWQFKLDFGIVNKMCRFIHLHSRNQSTDSLQLRVWLIFLRMMQTAECFENFH